MKYHSISILLDDTNRYRDMKEEEASYTVIWPAGSEERAS